MRGGGCVVRLAGLYSLQRGAHSVWLDEKSVSGFPSPLVVLSVRFYRYTFFVGFRYLDGCVCARVHGTTAVWSDSTEDPVV